MSLVGGSDEKPFIQPTSGDKSKPIPSEKKVPTKEGNVFKETRKKEEIDPNKTFKGTLSTAMSKAEGFFGKMFGIGAKEVEEEMPTKLKEKVSKESSKKNIADVKQALQDHIQLRDKYAYAQKVLKELQNTNATRLDDGTPVTTAIVRAERNIQNIQDQQMLVFTNTFRRLDPESVKEVLTDLVKNFFSELDQLKSQIIVSNQPPRHDLPMDEKTQKLNDKKYEYLALLQSLAGTMPKASEYLGPEIIKMKKY